MRALCYVRRKGVREAGPLLGVAAGCGQCESGEVWLDGEGGAFAARCGGMSCLAGMRLLLGVVFVTALCGLEKQALPGLEDCSAMVLGQIGFLDGALGPEKDLFEGGFTCGEFPQRGVAQFGVGNLAVDEVDQGHAEVRGGAGDFEAARGAVEAFELDDIEEGGFAEVGLEAGGVGGGDDIGEAVESGIA